MPTPAPNKQSHVNRQYATTLQQCFTVLAPVVFQHEDVNDRPRQAQFDNTRARTLSHLLIEASKTAKNAAGWYPELIGLDNHALRTSMRLDSLLRLVQTTENQHHGYALATVAYAVIESLPTDLFHTDADARAAESAPA